MPILSFNKRFVGKIKNGSKRQTIRALRKYPIRSGDKLYLYTALRTKYAKKLRDVHCKMTEQIKITRRGITIYSMNIPVAFYPGNHIATDAIARNDGFKDWAEMKAWWLKTHGLPFHGTIIYW